MAEAAEAVLAVAATVMDGDVSRRFVNAASTAAEVAVVDNRSSASTAVGVVPVIGLPAVVSANRSLKTLVRPTVPRSSSSTTSSSSNSRPAERDGLCCWVLCRRRFWRLVTFGPLRDDDGSYDEISAVLCGRSPSQSSAGAVFRAVPGADLRGSFLLGKQTYEHKHPFYRPGQKGPDG